MSALTREALWGRLREAALVQGDPPERSAGRSPWFVRVMLGFAGWIGAVFLLFFVGIGFEAVMESAALAMVVGAGACAAAAVIYRSVRGDFASQFALAVSLAGQALLAFGLGKLMERQVTGIALALALQQALLFVVVPNFIHRLWCAWSAMYAAQFAMSHAGFSALAPAFVTAGFIAVWLREFEHAERGELLRAGGYGLALAAVTTAVMHGGLRHTLLLSMTARGASGSQALAWTGAAASGAVLLWAVVALLRREQVPLASGPGKTAIGAAAILALASLKAPGLGPAVTILVVGYANGNRVLCGLGIAALIGYLSHYYYSLQATLLEKSALLACTGLVLLAARLALHRWWPLAGEGERHA